MIDITSQSTPPNDFPAIKTNYKTQLSIGSVGAAIASKGMSDADARAAVADADNIVDGLRAIGLEIFDDTGLN